MKRDQSHIELIESSSEIFDNQIFEALKVVSEPLWISLWGLDIFQFVKLNDLLNFHSTWYGLISIC